MIGPVDIMARSLGWAISRANVVVEGTQDVALIQHAADLYHAAHGIDLLKGELSIIAAGYGQDGGVDGLNPRLIAMRQAAAVDLDQQSRLRYRFIGLYDNDPAGRSAVKSITAAVVTIRQYSEVFLLKPAMALKGGADPATVKTRFERDNAAYSGLDWEIEDLLSPALLELFEEEHPAAIRRSWTLGDRTHRDFSPEGKRQLQQFVRDYAGLSDVTELIRLIRALRDYTHLRIDHIQV